MKTGKTLVELATEIERQRESRVDYIAPTQKLAYEPILGTGHDDVVMTMDGQQHGLALNDLAHRQVGGHVNIPAAYYDRMRSQAPALLSTNVNHWFEANPENRMIRTLDGRVRAFLSDRFRPLENADLAEVVLPIFHERPDLAIVSCEITERRLYIKAVDRACVREVQGRQIIDGRAVDYDHVSPSLTVSNSEVGSGALSVERGMFKHGCRNMAIFRESSLRKYHVGARHQITDELVAMLSDRSRQLTDAAVWSQVQDVVRAALSPDHFDKALEGVRALYDQRITGDVVKVVDLAARTLNIAEMEKPSVLRHLIEGGDLTRWGLLNAITRTAEDLPDYDRSTDFERMGGEIIELAQADWKRIAEAA